MVKLGARMYEMSDSSLSIGPASLSRAAVRLSITPPGDDDDGDGDDDNDDDDNNDADDDDDADADDAPGLDPVKHS